MPGQINGHGITCDRFPDWANEMDVPFSSLISREPYAVTTSQTHVVMAIDGDRLSVGAVRVNSHSPTAGKGDSKWLAKDMYCVSLL